MIGSLFCTLHYVVDKDSAAVVSWYVGGSFICDKFGREKRVTLRMGGNVCVVIGAEVRLGRANRIAKSVACRADGLEKTITTRCALQVLAQVFGKC